MSDCKCRICGKMGRYRGSIGNMDIWLCDECLPKFCDAIKEYGMNHD
jgi:ribosomal protein L37AE/L43A